MRNGHHEDPGTDLEPSPGPAARPLLPRGWRWGTPVVLAVCGGLLITSASVSDGSDLRPSRWTDISSTVKADKTEADRLTGRVASLNAEIEELTAAVHQGGVGKLNTQVRRLAGPAGFTEVHGAGVVVELDDAPESVASRGGEEDNLQVVHQQDLQGVINALWDGGARAVTLMGQRIISTTGIKCEGNVVTLHGIPYAPPYRIAAIGDQDQLMNALEYSRSVQAFRESAADPTIGVRYSSDYDSDLTAPAYEGLTTLEYATPAG